MSESERLTATVGAARSIAKVSLDAIRDVVAKELPSVRPEAQKDFIKLICRLMAEMA